MHSKHRGNQKGVREGGREVTDDGGTKEEGSEGERKERWQRVVMKGVNSIKEGGK